MARNGLKQVPPLQSVGLKSFLYLPPFADSLEYRAYLARIGPVTLLELLIEKLRVIEESRVTILCSDEPKFDEVTEIARARETDIIRVIHSRPIEAFSEALKKTGATNAAFFTIELCLAPDDLLAITCRHHLTYGNDYTQVIGLPDNLTPAIYSESLLHLLASLLSSVPFFPSDPKLAIDFLSRLPDNALDVVSVPFAARHQYGVEDIEGLPNFVRIATPQDVEVLREITFRNSSNGFECPLGKLLEWKEIRQQLRDEQRQQFRVKTRTLTRPGKSASSESTSRKRILFISGPSVYTGGAASLCELAAHIDRRRFDLSALVALRGYFVSRLEQLKVNVVCPEHDFMADGVDNFLYALITLQDLAPDIIHLNDAVGMPVVYAATTLGIPVIQHLRIVDFDARLVDQASAADLVIAISNFVKREAIKYEIASEKIRVIFIGVDPDRYHPDSINKIEMRRKYMLPLSSKIILMTARFTRIKRHDVILRAAQILLSRGEPFHLVLNGELYGASEDYDRTRAEVERSGLSNHVTFLGFVEDIRELYAASDVLVLCSDREAFGRCVLEAMSMGLPVIVTNSGGAHEIVEDGKTGFVIRSGDAEALADRLIRVLDGSSVVRVMSNAARELVINSTLNARNSARLTMQTYTDLIKRSQREHTGPVR